MASNPHQWNYLDSRIPVLVVNTIYRRISVYCYITEEISQNCTHLGGLKGIFLSKFVSNHHTSNQSSSSLASASNMSRRSDRLLPIHPNNLNKVIRGEWESISQWLCDVLSSGDVLCV
ncbi:unnamed protein product [Trichobilharzia szidati]|nr:unnamed protein product [Trichobilharzia szidati]CAH8868231.1 unnamed protein product [Trichobilharzia szidati]